MSSQCKVKSSQACRDRSFPHMQSIAIFSTGSRSINFHRLLPRPVPFSSGPFQRVFTAAQRSLQTSQTNPVPSRFFHPAASKLAIQKFSTAPSDNPSPTAHVATQRSEAIARQLSPSQPENNMNLYTYSKTPSEYTPRTVGQPYTLDYRCYIEKNGQPISPFHDIPLYANEQQTILNMVVEIPRWSNAKQEVSTYDKFVESISDRT